MTIAGSGEEGFKDGISSISLFNFPNGIVIDKNGDIIIADTDNHRIRKLIFKESKYKKNIWCSIYNVLFYVHWVLSIKYIANLLLIKIETS